MPGTLPGAEVLGIPLRRSVTELDGERVRAELVPLLTDPSRLAAMGAAARGSGHADAADRLAHLVIDVGRTRKNTGGEAA